MIGDLERTIPITDMNTQETFDGYQNLSFDTKKILEELITDSVDYKNIVLKEKNLFIGEILGKGQFGIVYLGSYVKNRKSLHVAIKTMYGDSKEQDVRAFLKEILRMKKFNHPNVLLTFGLVLRSNMPLAVMPYMKFGDLKGYISNKTIVSMCISCYLNRKRKHSVTSFFLSFYIGYNVKRSITICFRHC